MSADQTFNDEGAECPVCGLVTGDCFEWLNDEMKPVDFECSCGALLTGEVSYSVTYTVEVRVQPDQGAV